MEKLQCAAAFILQEVRDEKLDSLEATKPIPKENGWNVIQDAIFAAPGPSSVDDSPECLSEDSSESSVELEGEDAMLVKRAQFGIFIAAKKRSPQTPSKDASKQPQ